MKRENVSNARSTSEFPLLTNRAVVVYASPIYARTRWRRKHVPYPDFEWSKLEGKFKFWTRDLDVWRRSTLFVDLKRGVSSDDHAGSDGKILHKN